MFSRESFPIVSSSSLDFIGKSHTLRCDARQSEKRFVKLETLLSRSDCFFLGDVLPSSLIKGSQPTYIDNNDGVPVINTLSIQNMRINQNDCRYISEDSFESLSDDKKLKINDVLLTMDGGTSIGKPALFEFDGDWTVDSHVAILRPKGISPKALAYLLASPIGQLQFQKAESGASGQTAVTEEDLRRFIFPKKSLETYDFLTESLDSQIEEIHTKMDLLLAKEREAWELFASALIE